MNEQQDVTNVVLDSRWQQARGVIGRYPTENERYVFPFADVAMRRVHMIGVRRPLRVTWYAHNKIEAKDVLEPWTGTAAHKADCITEGQG